MTKEEKGSFNLSFMAKTFAQNEQFEQWLRSLFALNDSLMEEYNSIYQEVFFIRLQEVLTEGETYAKHKSKLLEDSNQKDSKWHEKLTSGIEEIKKSLTEAELEYIEYRRHNSCHIFQNGYEFIQKNYKIKKNRKGKTLQQIRNQIEDLLREHGNDRGIETHLNKILQPKIKSLYRELTENK